MPTADDIETQVIKWVAHVAEMPPGRITLSTRLLEDLGIDGDDAVNLFEGVHERFGADLTHLYADWSEHFGSEGLPMSAGFFGIPAMIASGFVFALSRLLVGAVVAGFISAIVLTAVFVASIRFQGGFSRDLTPITVVKLFARSRLAHGPAALHEPSPISPREAGRHADISAIDPFRTPEESAAWPSLANSRTLV